MWFGYFQAPFYLRSVILNLQSGEALSGAAWSTRGPWITLRNAQLLKAGSVPMPIDGEAIVHRQNVAFIQVLP